MGRGTTRQITRRAFREVNRNEPGAVKKTRKKKGKAAAERQRTAIALSKARRAGAGIPRK